MSKQSTLKSAIVEDSVLHVHIREGAGALSRRDLVLIQEKLRPRIGDSLNLDEASRREAPEENRWDYILSFPDIVQMVGIEPHTAKDSEISVLVAKKKFAIAYLRNHFKAGCRVHRWLWVTHGTVGFSKMDRARRRLDQHGIEFVGRALHALG